MKTIEFVSVFVPAALLLAISASGQVSHRLGSSQVVVSDKGHWENWEFAEGTIDISDSGEIIPHFWRKNTNAVLDIVDHLRWNPPEYIGKKAPEEIGLADAISAGSNQGDVVNALDGDPDTYWEPDPPQEDIELSGQWWFVIDLGRIVLTDRIVLRFVEEGEGDPFLLFDVLVSTGERPSSAPASKSLNYLPVIQTLRANKTQRVFEVDMSSLTSTKRIVRFVQVAVRGSDLDRGHEITREEHERLQADSPRDAGLVEYTKVLSAGGEIAISRDDWERLEESRRGPIRYFRKERPRLAELEVWGPGDDLAGGVLRRGGSIVNTSPTSVSAQLLIDGDVESADKMSLSSPEATRLADEVFMDLGSFFWIDSGKLAAGSFGQTLGVSWYEYRMQLSDGSRDVDGGLAWTTMVSRNGKKARIGVQDEAFAPIKARFFRIEWDVGFEAVSVDNLGQARISEIQLFGEGYQPEVTLTSDLIRLGGTRNLSTIEWDAGAKPGTRVVLQTRTGNTLDTLLHYFKADGTEVTEAQYNKIRIKSQKGDIVPEEVASADWEPWSAPYENPRGSEITSPSPREFMKIRATLLSDDPMARPELRAVRVNFASPLAGKLEGRVLPTLVDSLGVNRLFSLIVDIESLESGFDEVLIEPPPGMQLSFDPASESLYTGMASDFDGNAGLESLALESVHVLSQGDSLHLSFPEIGEAEVLRVDFRGKLFSSGGRMRVSVGSSARDGLWQRVDEEVPRNSLQLVALPESKDVFQYLTVTPRIFSPNGDGINDEMVMEFTVVLVGASTAVEAEIFDLTGRLVRSLEQQRAVSTGRYAIPWDGKDDGGNRLPPGLYAVRLRLDTDTDGTGIERREIIRTVGLGY